MAKEKCFIIAPISTSPERAALHLNDDAHCEHVIEHLLVPSVVKAGFEPIKPKAKGANIIHAEIVQNLQTAALVLCDMSGLNPNVFFELGIRTAMNKPICLTIDEATKDPPFDLDLVNHHSYVSDPRPWVLPAEVEKLAEHIKESALNKENALWKYFSLRVKAEITERPGPVDKLDLLVAEFDALRKQIAGANITERESLSGWDRPFGGRKSDLHGLATVRDALLMEADLTDIKVDRHTINSDGRIVFGVAADTSDDAIGSLIYSARRRGVHLDVQREHPKRSKSDLSDPG